jgi:hypothetical protein
MGPAIQYLAGELWLASGAHGNRFTHLPCLCACHHFASGAQAASAGPVPYTIEVLLLMSALITMCMWARWHPDCASRPVLGRGAAGGLGDSFANSGNAQQCAHAMHMSPLVT